MSDYSDADEDRHIEMVRMYQQLWAVNRGLVDRLSRRLTRTALLWGAGGFWFGLCIGLALR